MTLATTLATTTTRPPRATTAASTASRARATASSTSRRVACVARARREREDEVRRSVDAGSLADGRVNRFVERERGEKRAERAVVGFWQTFAERASEARRRHFDGRKTIDGKSSERK